MTEDTFYYWRRKLQLDLPPDEKVLEKSSAGKFFRPFFFFPFACFTEIFCPIRVEGAENIPKAGPYIIAPNHVSILDYPTLALKLDPSITSDLYVLSSRAYYDVAVARFFMKWVANVIRVDITEDFLGTLRLGSYVLRLGKNLVVFPEGTRSKTGELSPFRIGLGVLSIECNVPIVPVYISGLEKVLPKGAPHPSFGGVRVCFGAPLYPDKYKKDLTEEHAYYLYKELTEEVQQRVLNLKNSVNK